MRWWLVVSLGVMGCDAGSDRAGVKAGGRGLPGPLHEGGPGELRRLGEVRASDGVLRLGLRAGEVSGVEGYRVGWNGEVPGPLLRLKPGERLEVELENGLAWETSIHWHGVGAPWAMDGGLLGVGPGERFAYAFEVRRRGTFWYHPHMDTDGQVDGGLFGAVVVDEEPAEGVEELVVIADLPGESVGGMGHGMGPRPGVTGLGLGEAWWLNGGRGNVVRARPGGWLHVRMVNASNAGYLFLEGGDGLRWIAGGQGGFEVPRAVDGVVVPPGARVELLWEVGESRDVVWTRGYSAMGGLTWGERVPLVVVEPEGERIEGVVDPFRAGERVTLGVGEEEVEEVVAFGGSDRSGRWTVDGLEWPARRPRTWRVGATPVVEVRNVSPSHHPFHLHGQRFVVEEGEHRRWEDTVDVPAMGMVRLRWALEAEGEWMAHCHILPHAEGGMMTTIVVEP